MKIKSRVFLLQRNRIYLIYVKRDELFRKVRVQTPIDNLHCIKVDKRKGGRLPLSRYGTADISRSAVKSCVSACDVWKHRTKHVSKLAEKLLFIFLTFPSRN
jgi:hypothetical protein